MTKGLSLSVGGLLLFGAGCVSTVHEAQMGGIATPGSNDVYQTTLTGRMGGKSSAMTISPGFVSIVGGESSAEMAHNRAVGNALWDRDDTDALIGTKTKVETTNFLGLFETSTAEVKGIGVGVIVK